MIVVTGGAGFIGSAFVCETERRRGSTTSSSSTSWGRPRSGRISSSAGTPTTSTRTPSSGWSRRTGFPSPSRRSSTWAPAPRRRSGTPTTSWRTISTTPAVLRTGRWRTESASSTRAPRRPTATARRASPTTDETTRGAPADQHVRLLQAALRPEGPARGDRGQGRGDQVLQRLRPERVPQGRHDERDLQGLPPDPRNGQGPALQILPAGISRRRADAGFRLRQGLRRGPLVAPEAPGGERDLQPRDGQGADLERSDPGGLCRPEPPAGHRLHRDARGDPGAVPVFHRGEDGEAPGRRLSGRVSSAGGGGRGLREDAPPRGRIPICKDIIHARPGRLHHPVALRIEPLSREAARRSLREADDPARL